MNSKSQQLNLMIHKSFEGIDIKSFLMSFHLAKKTIHQLLMGYVSINHERVHENFILHENDRVTLDFSFRSTTDNIKPICHEVIDIVYEDHDLLIVNKPDKLLVYDDTLNKDNLTSRVACYMDKQNHPFSVLPAHRLDEDTSGMIIFAKHPLSLAYMSYLFESRQIDKQYRTLVLGPLAKEKMTISKPIGRDRHQNRMRVSTTGVEAITHYQVISQGGQHTRLNVWIEGGRKHQIRVHMSSIGHPIVGDFLYGGIHANRLMLHFYQVSFIHPMTRQSVSFVSPENF